MHLPKTKSNYLLLVCGVILFIIFIALIVFSFTSSLPAKPAVTINLTPTPVVFPPSLGNNVEIMKHDSKADEKQIERLKNRTTLSPSDSDAKQKLLALIKPNDPDKIIYQNSSFSIDYLKTLDFIQVQILVTNVDKTKQEAVNWFLQQGLSLQGICTLPVDFYVNYNVALVLKNTDYIFSPLAPGCE